MDLDGYFKLTEKGTTFETEVLAGFTTFLTMIYIVPANALIMSNTGMPSDALIAATALISILATVFNGFCSNTPVVL